MTLFRIDQRFNRLFNLLLRNAIQRHLGLLAKLEPSKNRGLHAKGLANQDGSAGVVFLDDRVYAGQKLSRKLCAGVSKNYCVNKEYCTGTLT